MGGGKVLCRVGLVLIAWEGGRITGAAVLPGLSGEVLHPGGGGAEATWVDKGGDGLSFLPGVFREVQLKGGGGKGCTRATDVLRRRVTGLTVFPGIGKESVLFAGGGGGGVTGDIWVGKE